MDKHRGFILYAVLISLLIATLLALALAKATLLHQKINQQFNNGRLTQLEALNGIYYVSQSNPLRLADTWKILTVPGPWPDDIVTEAKLRHLQFLPDTLSFLETQGDDVYGLSVRSRNQNNDIKAWHVTWWQRDNSVSYQYLGLSAPVIIGQFPLSRYADRLKASPDLLSRYRVYQQQVETQEALAYQIDTRGYLQVRAFKTGKRIWQEKLAKPEAGQSARLSAADVYVDHAWHTVLLAIIGNQVWLFDTTGRIQHSLSCWWHVKTNNAQQFSGTLFQAGNGQWLVMLSLSSKLSRIQFLALKNGRLVSQIPLAADSHALTPPVVIDYQQNLVGNWAYVGDERGRLWAINLAGAPGSWHSATVIFNAEDQQHQVQSIQKAPAIAVSGQAQIAIYLLAGNAAHSSVYGLQLQRLDQVVRRRQLIQAQWPVSGRRVDTGAGWVMDSPAGQQFESFNILDDRLWYGLRKGRLLYVGALQRNTGSAVSTDLFRAAPQQGYVKLPIHNDNWQLYFYQQPWRLETAGNQVLLYPHPYRSGRQGLYLMQ